MQSGDLRLLVGLGNPGQRYASTRHNVGFMALEAFASRESTRFKAMAKLQGELAEVGVGSNRLRLLMPQTFMNESGVRFGLPSTGLICPQIRCWCWSMTWTFR